MGEGGEKKNDFNFKTNLHLNGEHVHPRQIYLSNHEMWTQLGSSINIITYLAEWWKNMFPVVANGVVLWCCYCWVLIMIFKLMGMYQQNSSIVSERWWSAIYIRDSHFDELGSFL